MTGNGAYGVYPVMATNVHIDGVEVSGAADAAIYVGQSSNILVENSLAFDSVAGIEIENSSDAEVKNNTSHDNVAGILVFTLPQLPTKVGARANVHDNTIMNNNRVTFAASGSIVSAAPRGTGILILAAHNTEVHGNTISGNESMANIVVSCDALDLVNPGVLHCDDPGYAHFPDGTYIHDNIYSNNGTMPHDYFVDLGITTGYTVLFANQGAPAPTSDTQLCIKEAASATFLNFLAPTETLAAHDCTHAALPSINVTWGTSP
jgi:parallel beta-helix repeat protein